jgi:hypothetical protein
MTDKKEYLIEIKKIIDMLRARNDDNMSTDFLSAFENFIISGDNTQYCEWMRKAISGFYKIRNAKPYRGASKNIEDLKSLCEKDYKLFLDIKKNGIKVPISVFKDKYGTEIDGYHRLIIAKVLGKRYIECEQLSEGNFLLSWSQPIRALIKDKCSLLIQMIK